MRTISMPGDHLRHRVLHLNARIHFDEVPVVGVGVDQEFDRAGVVVAGRASQRDRGIARSWRTLRVEVTAGATSTTF